MEQLVAALTRAGRRIPVDGHHLLSLVQPECAWLVVEGQVDLFSSRSHEGTPSGPRRYLASLDPGALLLGHAREDHEELGLLASGQPGTHLVEFPVGELNRALGDPAQAEPSAQLVNGWIETLSRTLPDRVRPRRRTELAVGDPGEQVSAGTPICAAKGVGWLRCEEDEVRLVDRMLGEDGVSIGALPLTPWTWITRRIDTSCQLMETRELLADGLEKSPDLKRFHSLVLQVIAERTRRERQRAIDQMSQSRDVDEKLVSKVLRRLSRVQAHRSPNGGLHGEADEPPALQAARSVCATMGIPLPEISWREAASKGKDPLDLLLAKARVRTRDVVLKGDWWAGDHGPLLAWRRYGNDREPVALLPGARGGYLLEEPTAGDKIPVNQRVAETLDPLAIQFYRPLPDAPPSPSDLVLFATHGLGGTLSMVLGLGLLSGLLGLVVPLATGRIFDDVIPGADRPLLYQLLLALLAIGLGQSLFGITRGFALQRIEVRMSASMQAAVWDRLISLPAPFFREFTSGDLAERAMGIDRIRQVLTGSVMGAILSGIFSIWNLALLFYYDARLAQVAVLLVIAASAVAVVSARLQLGYQRQLLARQGRISGLLLQLLVGISKLKVSATEDRAFSVWASEFAAKREIEFHAENLENRFEVFHAVFPLLCTMVLFWIVGTQVPPTLTLGGFLAFSAAFGTFLAASLGLVSAALNALTAVALWERALPILEERPERVADGVSPGELSGRIEVGKVSFRYENEGPLVLQDVEFEVEPGEFLAIVGPSGSGKSTLFRLLLGFEQPIAGGIYFDGQSLSRLDVGAVRRQFGVVLQNSRVLGGDIYSNIAGSSRMSLEDAWAAAEAAALAEDIRAMPMQLHTVITEGGGTLSGGQRQRLLIARALARSPRILFFDEATSALDNRTQAVVSESLEQLQATRIVVAHRLSTVRNADRILVLKKGRLVEQGNHASLMELGGEYAKLARRQIA
jgi:NHLM bacteriocin system ABC transporter ATP-binding protein